jgi:hypothetical protein
MSDHEENGGPRHEPRRRPYEEPAFLWEDDLGTRPGLIAACNKTAPLEGSCDLSTLQS